MLDLLRNYGPSLTTLALVTGVVGPKARCQLTVHNALANLGLVQPQNLPPTYEKPLLHTLYRTYLEIQPRGFVSTHQNLTFCQTIPPFFANHIQHMASSANPYALNFSSWAPYARPSLRRKATRLPER
jgi:hypothetical protein